MATSSRRPRRKFLADEEQAAWGGVLAVHATVVRALDRSLRADHGISVLEFDVLITLFNAPGSRLRMIDLANAVMLSAAGLTQLVNRLALAGLVERNVDPGDRRSFLIGLTKAGLDRLDAARATHNHVIRAHFLDRLTPEEIRQLAKIWAAVENVSI